MPVARTPDHSSITSVIISFWISFSRVELMRGHQRPIVRVHGPVCPPARGRTGIPPAWCMELPFWAKYNLTILSPQTQKGNYTHCMGAWPCMPASENGHPTSLVCRITILGRVRSNRTRPKMVIPCTGLAGCPFSPRLVGIRGHAPVRWAVGGPSLVQPVKM